MKGYWFFLLSFSILGGFCATVKGQAGESPTEQPPGLSISIKQPQRGIKVGKDVRVVVTIANVSSEDLFVGPFLTFEVLDAAGKPVPTVQPKPGPAGYSASSDLLKPGQSMDRTINLKEQFAIEKAGRYSVQALRVDYGRRGGKVRGRIKSNTITIEIVE